MAKTIITFKAIRNGRLAYKNIPIFHEFEVLPPMEFDGIQLPATSVERQVMEYLDETDKSELMREHGFDIILDYFPRRRRNRKDEIEEFMNFSRPYLERYPQIARPFSAVAHEARKTLFGKGKSNEQKFREVASMVGVSLKTATGVFSYVAKILRESRTEALEE